MFISFKIIPLRIGAYLIDYLLLFTALVMPQFVLSAITGGFPFNLLKTGPQIELWVLLTLSLPAWLYFSLLESSARGATLGKRLLRLRVVSLSADRISFGRALLRTAVKLLPWELTHLSVLLPTPLLDPAAPPRTPYGLIAVYGLLGIYLAAVLVEKNRRSVDDLIAGTIIKVV